MKKEFLKIKKYIIFQYTSGTELPKALLFIEIWYDEY